MSMNHDTSFELKKETREIDGLTFTTSQLPAMASFTLFGRLVKAVGPAFGALSKLDPSTPLDGAAGELAGAFSAIDVDEATRLVPQILSRTTVAISGRHENLQASGAVDRVFSGRLGTMFKVLVFALQVNYSDFLPGSAQAASQLPGPHGG